MISQSFNSSLNFVTTPSSSFTIHSTSATLQPCHTPLTFASFFTPSPSTFKPPPCPSILIHERSYSPFHQKPSSIHTCMTQSSSSSSSSSPSTEMTPYFMEIATKLATWISKDFSNATQSMKYPQIWAHIHTSFRPLRFSLLDGIALYNESAYDFNLDQPYKASVVKLCPVEPQNDPLGRDTKNLVRFEQYKIAKRPEEFWLGWKYPELLEPLTRDMLVNLPMCCECIFEWQPDQEQFEGRIFPAKVTTETQQDGSEKVVKIEGGCRVPRNGKMTYLESHVMLKPNNYYALDVGRCIETNEVIWGGEVGPFEFDVREDYSADVAISLTK